MATENFFNKFWENSEKQIFRLETLNEYKVEEEKTSFEAYQNNKIIKNENFDEWLELIENTTKKGIDIYRVHVIDLPLTDYIRYEIECGYLLSQKKGERFLLVERKKVQEIIQGFDDFWLFDDSQGFTIKYDNLGNFLGFGDPITEEEISKYIELRDKITKMSIPLDEFLKIHSITFNRI